MKRDRCLAARGVPAEPSCEAPASQPPRTATAAILGRGPARRASLVGQGTGAGTVALGQRERSLAGSGKTVARTSEGTA